MIISTFRQGEDGTIALDVVAGDPALVTASQGSIRRSRNAALFDPDPVSVPIALIMTARAALGAIPAGWNLTLPAAQTATLRPGIYGIDARFTLVGGSVEITDEPALVRVTGSAFG
jgi:hypothetical protein